MKMNLKNIGKINSSEVIVSEIKELIQHE